MSTVHQCIAHRVHSAGSRPPPLDNRSRPLLERPVGLKIEQKHIISPSYPNKGMSLLPLTQTNVCQSSLLPKQRHVTSPSYPNKGMSLLPLTQTNACQSSHFPKQRHVNLPSYPNKGMSLLPLTQTKACQSSLLSGRGAVAGITPGSDTGSAYHHDRNLKSMSYPNRGMSLLPLTQTKACHSSLLPKKRHVNLPSYPNKGMSILPRRDPCSRSPCLPRPP